MPPAPAWKLIIAGLKLLQHGVVILFRRHLADGHQVVPGSAHFFVPLDLCFRLAGLDSDLLALFRVVPKTGSLLHGVEPLQLTAQPLHIQRIRQTIQRGAAVVQFLLVGIKSNIHRKSLTFISIV